jgi:hypothetical protein
MVHADAALFTGLGHYWSGMAQIQRAELSKDEREGLKAAATEFRLALEQVGRAREHEERILALAEPIEYSAYFVRRHSVASQATANLYQGLEELTQDVSDGYYPARACFALNRVLARMMANFEQDARIEGVLNRLEKSSAP